MVLTATPSTSTKLAFAPLVAKSSRIQTSVRRTSLTTTKRSSAVVKAGDLPPLRGDETSGPGNYPKVYTVYLALIFLSPIILTGAYLLLSNAAGVTECFKPLG